MKALVTFVACGILASSARPGLAESMDSESGRKSYQKAAVFGGAEPAEGKNVAVETRGRPGKQGVEVTKVRSRALKKRAAKLPWDPNPPGS